MKKQTLELLLKHITTGRIEFSDVDEGLAVEHDLTDDELRELVELEYGTTSQSVDELFKVLCKKLLKEALK